MSFPVNYQQEEMWVQVYVPVMEAISKGSGLQYARFQFDWNTLKKVSDETKIESSLLDFEGLYIGTNMQLPCNSIFSVISIISL